jgi:hypothetical protein
MIGAQARHYRIYHRIRHLVCQLAPELHFGIKLARAALLVIRITARKEQSHTVIAIDGELTTADIGEIRRIRKSVKGKVVLKLRGLNACAVEGIRVLRDWLNTGDKLSNATPFLQVMLKSTKKCSKDLS